MANLKKLDEIMSELGHQERHVGTGYIREAVSIYERGMSMTKDLYPALAKAAGTTPSRLERAMRHSITSAWARGNTDAQHRLFGYSVDPERGSPMVSEYVARMARICRDD